MARKSSPDECLSPLNFESLNETFYAAEPADYFDRRLRNLILVAGNRQGLDRLFSEGVRYGGLSVGGGQPAAGEPSGGGEAALRDRSIADPAVTAVAESDDQVAIAERAKEDRASEDRAAHFVTAEAEVLAHHAGETLLRLYLAHEFSAETRPPPCPSLDLARLRTISQFKDQVRHRFGSDSNPGETANLDAVARVFHGSPARETLTPAPPADLWEKSLANIESYLRAFARQHLDSAPLYNAAKHGLAVTPTETGIQWGDGSLVKVEGPAIQYLEVRRDDHGRPRWQQVTHWVKADRQMALAFRTCQLIDMLWEVARHRYLAARRSAPYRLALFVGPSYLDVVMSGDPASGGIEVTDLREELLYDAPAERMDDVGRG